MKQVTSKTPEKDIKNVLGSGFEVVAEMVDEKMLRLRVYNVETGDHFTITKMGDYSSDIRCLVKEPPKMETVARLYGTVGGVQYVKDFRIGYDAVAMKEKLTASGAADLQIVDVEVEVKDE